MELQLKRIVLFSPDVERLARFYQEVIGLSVVGRERGWIDLNAGACNVAIHAGRSKVGNRPPKLVFYSADVAATRSILAKRGLNTMGPVVSTPAFDMCDGKDPDGNAIAISGRK